MSKKHRDERTEKYMEAGIRSRVSMIPGCDSDRREKLNLDLKRF